eukprot:1487933-Rhodomonas_salina.1
MASPFTSSSHLLPAPPEIPETIRQPTLRQLPEDLPILVPTQTHPAPSASPKPPPGPKATPP